MFLRNISYRTIILISFIFAFCFLSVSYFQYYQSLKSDTLKEYQRIESALSRTMKILAALTYTISTDYLAPEVEDKNIPLKHIESQQHGMCWFIPQKKQVTATHQKQMVTNIDKHDINYLILGLNTACDHASSIYQTIQEKKILAPIFSQLNEIDPFPTGLFFISKNDYGLVAPKELGMKLRPKDLEKLKQRQFWKNAEQKSAEEPNNIILNGPYIDSITQKPIVTFSIALRNADSFLGVSFIDVQLDELLEGKTEAWPFIDLVSLSTKPLRDDANLVKRIRLDNVEMQQFLLTHLNVVNGFQEFFKNHKSIFTFIFGLWVISTLGIFMLKAWFEKEHFIELSMRDPMTGLFNRRGLQANYLERKPLKYEAVAIFDIDNFKNINDQHGHDVGDQVICHLAELLSMNTRQTDIVARFGGEEFVVYISAKTLEQVIGAVKRMQETISGKPVPRMDLSFTVSCGLAYALAKDNMSLETLIKRADIKLYQAKNNGKNQVVV